MPPNSALAKSASTPAVFQRPVIQELYQGRSAIESTLDYRIPPQLYEGVAADGRSKHEGLLVGGQVMGDSAHAPLDITERHSECVAEWDVVKDRYARDVNTYRTGQMTIRGSGSAPTSVLDFRNGVTEDCKWQAQQHETLLAEAARERARVRRSACRRRRCRASSTRSSLTSSARPGRTATRRASSNRAPPWGPSWTPSRARIW
jgi:hypothetical protein